jgi:hypothetical protein
MSDTTERAELPDQVTISLSPPVVFDRRDYAQLVVREPRAGEVLMAEQQVKNSVNPWTIRNRQIHLIAKCSDVPLPVVEMLPMRKFNEAWAFISPFFTVGLETTEN